MVRVSIITACRNSGRSIEKTIQSVIDQTYKNIEYIIIDGDSNDNTKSIISNYDKNIDVFISEPDNGIAEAWNKGIKYARGELLAFLNAGDIYHPSTVADAVASYSVGTSSIIYGDCYIVTRGQIRKKIIGNFQRDRISMGLGFSHPTCFHSRDLFTSVGVFDQSYRIALDTEWLLRAISKQVPFIKSSHKVYMESGGISDKHFGRAIAEYRRALRKLHKIFPSPLERIIFLFAPTIRLIVYNCYLKNFARALKHLAISVLNFIQNHIPSVFLVKAFMRLRGFTLGNKAFIVPPTIFYKYGNLKLGPRTVINACGRIDNRYPITIGKDVSIAHDCSIYTTGHDNNSPFFEIKGKEVRIDDHVVIYAHVMIMPGVHIGEGAVLLPGSVVTKDVAPYTVAAGIPAKEISKRNKNLYYKIDYAFWKAL